MFGRKKAPPPPPKNTEGGKRLMAQMGFVGAMEDMVLNSPDDDDHDFEAELRALQEEVDSEEERNEKKAKRDMKPLSQAELNKLINMDTSELDEDVSDTEDPDIMAELSRLTSDTSQKPSSQQPPKSDHSSKPSDLTGMLEDRLNMYKAAIQGAKQVNDSSKARRYDRGLKKLTELLREVKAGRSIDQSEIPPTVAVPGQHKPAQQQEPEPSTQHPTQPPPRSFEPQQPSRHFEPQPPSRQFEPQQPPPQQIEQPFASTVTISFTEDNDSTQTSNQDSTSFKAPSIRPSPLPPTKPSLPTPTKQPSSSQATKPSSPLDSTSSRQSFSPTSKTDTSMREYCIQQRDLQKQLALQFKKQGRTTDAVNCMRNYKQFDGALRAIQEGREVDKTQLPTAISPTAFISAGVQDSRPKNEALQRSQVAPQMSDEDKKKLYKVPEAASNSGSGGLLQMLQLRMEKYNEAASDADKENNKSKGRRMKRIVKQYEDAIKSAKSGGAFNYSELPTPPGFPPLPTTPQPPQPSSPLQPSPSQLSPSQPSPSQPSPSSSDSQANKPKVIARPSSSKSSIQRQVSSAHSRAEQQAMFLEKRQLQFKKAAVEAKNSGDMELARKYLRLAKGFDQMIEASRAGLPVDISQIPAPPGDDTDFVFVESSDVPVEGEAADVYNKLQNELINQIKTSENNRDVFTKIGDISSATKFEKMAENSKRDLESLKNAYQHNDPVPRFHYETRHFSFVQCNHHLGDNDLEVTVVRAININPPSGYSSSDMNVYVKYEFPFPNDDPQCGETPAVKGVNPEFDYTAKLETNRKSRSFLRLLKSNRTFKFDLYYKRGFFKGDKILGSVQFKLLPLENKCTYHESFDLMDGRKAVGGKLEVMVKIRDPYLNKQIEERRERWLVIDEFTRSLPPKLPRQNFESSCSPPQASKSKSLYCISVLAYEREHLEQQAQNSPNAEVLRKKSALMQQKANEIKTALHKGGASAIKEYINDLRQLSQRYTQEAIKAEGDKGATKHALTKKALVHKEIDSLSRKLQG